MGESCINSGFFPEVSRKRKIPASSILFLQFLQHLKSPVIGAVIHEQKLVFCIFQTVQHFCHGSVKNRDNFLLIQAGNNDTDQFHKIYTSFSLFLMYSVRDGFKQFRKDLLNFS